MSKLREVIAQKPADLKTENVEGLGVQFRMRQLTYEEAQAIRKRREASPDDAENPIDWIIACAVDPETGENIFKDTAEDRKLLKGWPMWEVLRLSGIATTLNSSKYEDVEKNSEASQS